MDALYEIATIFWNFIHIFVYRLYSMDMIRWISWIHLVHLYSSIILVRRFAQNIKQSKWICKKLRNVFMCLLALIYQSVCVNWENLNCITQYQCCQSYHYLHILENVKSSFRKDFILIHSNILPYFRFDTWNNTSSSVHTKQIRKDIGAQRRTILINISWSQFKSKTQ